MTPLFSISVDESPTTLWGPNFCYPQSWPLCFLSQLTRARVLCGNLISGTLTGDPSVFYLSWRGSDYSLGALSLVPSQLTHLFSISVDESPTTPWEPYYWYPHSWPICFPSQLTRVPLPCGSLIIGTASMKTTTIPSRPSPQPRACTTSSPATPSLASSGTPWKGNRASLHR